MTLRVAISIRSTTSWLSSLAVIVRRSGARNASSALNRWPFGRLPEVGKRHRIAPASLTMRRRPFPRSAMSRPRPNRPALPGPIDAEDDGGVRDGPAGDPVGLLPADGNGEPTGDPDG